MSRAAELMAASVGRAAAALCATINIDVEPGEVEGDGVPVPVVPNGVRLGLGGDLQGDILLLVPSPATMGELMEVPAHLLDSAIGEVGNIVGSHLLLGLEEAAAAKLTITPPDITEDAADVAAWLEAGHHHRSWVTLRCMSPVILVLSLQDP